MIQLKNSSITGDTLSATFLPEGGMNLISYRHGDIEVIDQNTNGLYTERKAGLGALIGPHFHERKIISGGFDESLFPHIAKGKAEGRKDPFSHGIGRYVPWKYESGNNWIKASLSGNDLYKGVPLKVFEGQNFSMTYEAHLLSDGLHIKYEVESEQPSVIGLHYYYALADKGNIHGAVENTYRANNEWKPLPKEWTKEYNEDNSSLYFELPQKADYGFLPAKEMPNENHYSLVFDSSQYSLHIHYKTASSSEISCQVFHPNDASYVCIEPLSATCPPNPELTHSSLDVKLEIIRV